MGRGERGEKSKLSLDTENGGWRKGEN